MEKLRENKVLREMYNSAEIRNTQTRIGEMWHRSVANGLDEMEVDELPVAGIPHLVEVFRRAGIKTFVVTDKHNRLIIRLSGLQECGCTMKELCKISHPIPDSDKTMDVWGIRFHL